MSGTRALHRQSADRFTGDTIQAGLIQLTIRIPTHAQCRDTYEENFQDYKQWAKESTPGLGGFEIQDDMLATMQQPDGLTLLSGDEVIERSLDCSGNVYAVKIWERSTQDYEKIRTIADCVSLHRLPYLNSPS